MSRYSKTMSDTMAEVRAKEKELLEVSPPGFKGTVKAMKKHDEIDNPYALAWHMKNKGDEAHYKSKDGKPEKKEKYKEDVDEANLPPHLAKFFDKKGNPKPEVAKRMSDAARKKKVVSKDVTPKGYGPNEDIDILHAEAIQENGMVEEVEWKVKLRGLPMFYVPAKSAGQVRTMLRKQIKKPDDIISIERSTQAAKKKDFRGRVSGKDSES
jgi:hypothetical protein|tara:strand:- start:162 stop:794 length:633 start_codon:yes stop_codon:yes gene_type:complete